MTLREAWTSHVQLDDYEAHMARIGQAQANASLVQELVEGLEPGSRVLIAGAGTGQMFDFANPFVGMRVVCSDVNSEFLERCRARFDCETVVDNLEETRLTPGFALVVVVLVLEHVDWRKAVRSLLSLEPERLLIVIQANPSEALHVSEPTGSMEVFTRVRPQLVPEKELTAEVGRPVRFRRERAVADDKRMVGLLF